MIETLITADWPILVDAITSLSWICPTSRIQELARAVDGAAFLFAAGPLSNVIFAVMHRINPRNIYVDIGGSLDYFLINVRTSTRSER